MRGEVRIGRTMTVLVLPKSSARTVNHRRPFFLLVVVCIASPDFGEGGVHGFAGCERHRTWGSSSRSCCDVCALRMLSGSSSSAGVDEGGAERRRQHSIEVKIELPGGTNIVEPAIFAAGGVDIGHRARVDGSLMTTADRIEIGGHAEVGPITAIGDVAILEKAHVLGDVRASGAVGRHRSASVTGTVQEHSAIDPTTVTWTVTPPEDSLGSAALERGELRDLVPGTYEDLIVPRRAKVVVHTGIYVSMARRSRTSIARLLPTSSSSRLSPSRVSTPTSASSSRVRAATFEVARKIENHAAFSSIKNR